MIDRKPIECIEDIDGWFDYAGLYQEAIRRAPRKATLIELGVWCGKSLAFLAQEAIDQHRDDIRIIGIDLWDYSPAMNLWGGYVITEQKLGHPIGDLCEQNLTDLNLRSRVELMRSDTITAAQSFADGTVDFVWFDSNHEPEHVTKEIAAWLPKFRRPTWCAGHDVDSPGLFDAVRGHFPDAKKVAGGFGSWRVELPWAGS